MRSLTRSESRSSRSASKSKSEADRKPRSSRKDAERSEVSDNDMYDLGIVIIPKSKSLFNMNTANNVEQLSKFPLIENMGSTSNFLQKSHGISELNYAFW